MYEPEPARSAAGAVDRVALVSWNTHVGGGDLDALIDSVARGDFTQGTPLDAIVLVLQEVYRHDDGVPRHLPAHAAFPGPIIEGSHVTHARDAVRVARAHRFALLYAPSMRNGFTPGDPDDRGNAVMTTLPLRDPEVIELPFEHQRRVSVAATVSGVTSSGVPWSMEVADVQLDTAISMSRGGPLAARRRQAEALVTALDAAGEQASVTVVAGDFNTFLGSGEPAVRTLRRAFPDAPPLGPLATWRGPFGLRAPLDHVFARGRPHAMMVQRLPKRFGSDHYPLLADIRF